METSDGYCASNIEQDYFKIRREGPVCHAEVMLRRASLSKVPILLAAPQSYLRSALMLFLLPAALPERRARFTSQAF